MTYEEQLKQVRDNVIKNVYPVIQQQGSSNTMITLHWTAGHYDQLFDDYHMCIDGSGNVHVMQDLDNKGAHCYRENTNNLGISACSNYGSELNGDGYTGYSTYNPGSEPVNALQLEAMATLVYLCCVTWALPLSQVFTHGERCLLRQDLYDYPAERWDLDILVPECHVRTEDGVHTSGGNWIRNRAHEIARMNGVDYL